MNLEQHLEEQELTDQLESDLQSIFKTLPPIKRRISQNLGQLARTYWGFARIDDFYHKDHEKTGISGLYYLRQRGGSSIDVLGCHESNVIYATMNPEELPSLLRYFEMSHNQGSFLSTKQQLLLSAGAVAAFVGGGILRSTIPDIADLISSLGTNSQALQLFSNGLQIAGCVAALVVGGSILKPYSYWGNSLISNHFNGKYSLGMDAIRDAQRDMKYMIAYEHLQLRMQNEIDTYINAQDKHSQKA